MPTFPLRRGFTVYSRFRPADRPDHWGVDFGREGGSGGEDVHAIRAGTVTAAGAASGFGQWVLVDHPAEVGGGLSVYGHVLPRVRVGQQVAEGERVAVINPNSATNGGVPPHLHLEVHRYVWAPPGPARLDPLTVLGDAAFPGERAPAPTPAPEAPRMTLFGLDISNHQRGFDVAAAIREGYSAVFAKASEGTDFRDGLYAGFRDATRNAGKPFAAYHYLRAGDPLGNARNFHAVVNDPAGTVCMVDWEDGGGGGADLSAFIQAVRALGYTVRPSYGPRWYWERVGRPDLSDVPELFASNYRTTAAGYGSALYEQGGGDGHPGWEGYGGGTVRFLQFTSAARVAGQQVDAWAFKGSEDELRDYLTPGPVGEPQAPRLTPGGAIEAKYAEARSILGDLAFGEVPTPNGLGAYAHFQGGSIYWSPPTGAHVVHGKVRDEWAARGWENTLGFPVADEVDLPGGRVSVFERGAVTYWWGADTAVTRSR